MSKWLYSSKGEAVAFLSGDFVFSHCGTFLGILKGNEIWSERYVGEIVSGNRIVRQSLPPLGRVPAPPRVDIPEWPSGPAAAIEPMMLQTGYADVQIEEFLQSNGP